MLKQVGEYEPFGKRFLKEQSHLVQKQSKGPILFSFLKEPEYPCFHKLFSLSDDSTMDIGSRPDVKKLPLDNSSIIGDGKTKLDNPAFSLEQEVYVDNSTVIWSKGNLIITSFTYKDQLQSIQQVLFAWFPVKHAFYDDDPTRINSVTLDLDPQDPSFEEQQQQLNESSSSVPVNTNRNTQDTDNNGKTLRRGLCIVFQTFIEVHYTNGLSTTIHSPFSINNVAALDCGLLVTRKEPVRVERRSSRKEMHEPSISPYENVNFMMATNIQLTCPVITTGMETYTNRSGSSTLYHQPPTHTILYASTNPDLPLVVTCNSDNKHFIWCFERARTMGSKKGQKINPGEAKLRFLWKETAQRKSQKRIKSMSKSTAFMVHNIMGEPQICIMNYANHTMTVFDIHNLSVAVNFSRSARAAIPIQATRDTFYDILYLDTNGLHILIDKSLPTLDIHSPIQDVDDLIDPIHESFTIVRRSDKRMFRFEGHFRPKTPLIRDCLAAINCATDIQFAQFWFRFIKSLYFNTRQNTTTTPLFYHEWNMFMISLLSCFELRRPDSPKKKETNYEKAFLSNKGLLQYQFSLSDLVPSAFDPLFIGREWEGIHAGIINAALNNENLLEIPLSSIVKSLHVLYEEYRIQKTMQIQFKQLGYLLLQCSAILKNQKWINYYESHGFKSRFVHKLKLNYPDLSEVEIEPPNIQMCLKLLAPDTSSNPTILSFFGVNTLETSVDCYRNDYGRLIQTLWSLYSIIRNPTVEKYVLLNYMVYERITRKDVELLDDSVSLPILDTLNALKLAPSFNWPKEAYYIIGRNDIYKQLQLSTGDTGINQLNAISAFKRTLRKENKLNKTSMSDIMKESSLTPPPKRCTYESDILDMETERLRFGFGGDIEEIRLRLDASSTPSHSVAERPDASDEDVVREHQLQVGYVVQRILALGVGRALFVFATHLPDVKKALPIEVITLAVKILPLRTLVELEETSVTDDLLEWPQFHNGVTAGLRIIPNSDINESWIEFCNPDKLDPHHGGVLLGMGLNGTLKKLSRMSWYRLMTQYSCESARIGFLLGGSAAYRGTKDSKMTKILSVYIPALLPPNSTGFEHSNSLQAACLLGMGLVYMGSSDRYTTCVMLQQISKDAYSDPSVLDENFESCSLSAGFALGFITLGVGDDSPDLIDLQLRDKLYNLMTDRSVHLRATDSGAKNKHRQKNDDGRFINLDVTSHGATIALGLMYLKTENQRAANKVDILESQSYINYVRPDFLLVRVVAKNLIMWSEIQPTPEWIEQQIPDFIMTGNSNVRDEEASKQAKYNIQCGAFLCIGLRFAGSKNEQAFRLLLDHLDRFIRLWQTQDTSIHQQVTKKSISTCIDVLCTSAAMVMAGTGQQELASRLKDLYKRVGPKVNYGNHMAVSMALGLLFMGLGLYTFSNNNEAIAALLCSFYPFYPTTTNDNRYHLQALRHLWVIAADSRWLMPIDVDKEEPCRVPMYLTMYEDDERKQSQPRKIKSVRILAPSVLPNYKLIKSISIDENRYWPITVDLGPGEYVDSILKSGLLYIKMKDNSNTYEADPQGRRLMFI